MLEIGCIHSLLPICGLRCCGSGQEEGTKCGVPFQFRFFRSSRSVSRVEWGCRPEPRNVGSCLVMATGVLNIGSLSFLICIVARLGDFLCPYLSEVMNLCENNMFQIKINKLPSWFSPIICISLFFLLQNFIELLWSSGQKEKTHCSLQPLATPCLWDHLHFQSG